MLLGLTGLQFYVAAVIIFAIVYLFTPKKYIWFPFAVLTILFAVLAYHILPDPADDLNIYYHHMDVFREMGRDGLRYAINEDWFEWKTFRASLYYVYIISRFPNNNFLPAITILIVYSLSFDVLYKAAKRFEISKGGLFFAAMYVITTFWYYDVASGTRNGLAFVIAFATVYYHLVEKKNIFICLAGYLCAALMHSTGIIPIAIVFAALITKNLKSKFINILFIFGISGSAALIEVLADLTDNSFIQSIAGRAEVHGNIDPHLNLSMGSGGGNTMYLVTLVTFFVVLFLVLYFGPNIKKSRYSEELKTFLQYSSLTMCFLLGCAFTSTLIFVRFVRWIIPVIGGIYIMVGLKVQQDNEKKYIEDSFNNNIIPKKSLIYRLRPVVCIVLAAFMGVSFWYALNGSSLIFLHLR